ncbi:MAG: polyketide cyclase [Bacteroidales bacterium]|nr:polyketide cyclase [Bacteroidales bacterium]
MEAKYESAIKVVRTSADAIYTRLSNFKNFGNVFPPDKISNWSATEDTCRFTVDKIGEIGLRIVDRIVNNTVKYGADGDSRFDFNLWVQMKEVAPYDSRIKVTLKANLNPMIKMMVGSKLQTFVDGLADAISRYQY